MSKWQHRDEGKKVSKSVVASKTTEELKESKKFLKGLLDLRKSEKLEKTYIQGTKKAIAYNEKNKVFVDFRFDGTTTGRLSCAAYNAKKAMGVSFHTLPRSTETNIRSIFTAPKGQAFVTVDYAAMELRVLSHIAKEGNMQLAFNQGADLHTYTAQLLFNKFNLAETMAIPMKRAEKIIDNYKNVYPGIFEYMEFVNEYIKRNGYAYTIFGRRRNLPDVTSPDRTVVNRALRQGLNFTIQSTASDILLSSLLGIAKSLKDNNLNARPVATVHDSVELVCDIDCVSEVLEIVYDEMVNYPSIKSLFNIHFDVPLAIDAEVGRSFGDGVSVQFIDGRVNNLDEIGRYFQ